jgi:CRP-like cAMP-binding protein
MSGAVRGIEEIVREHPFFEGLLEPFGKLISGCARNVHFQHGAYIFREGDAIDQFYLIRQGHVALEINAPGRGAITFRTVQEDEIVGVSWLIPPYRWTYNARVVEFTRAIAIDASCLRGKCEADHDLGYEVMKRFMTVLIQQLHAAQVQILDVYGEQT